MALIHAVRRSDPAWERLCVQCGLCCYERQEVAGGVKVMLNRPCPHLNIDKGKCTVYERRFKVGALCRKVNLFHALFGRRMPLTCGYVQRYRPWMRRSA
ncbi:MAG: hypothetical protein E4H09_00755 [Spirochaetales bacterium]|nr:MAG: hypothetical protein E4H09_00755 [Spirochaetales bacterium]